MKFTKKKILIIVSIVLLGIIIIAILGILFSPKTIFRCDGEWLCFGYVKTEIQKSTWLNVKDSVFEAREYEVESCIGLELQGSTIYDGCWFGGTWYDKRPVNCDDELRYCNDPSQLQDLGIQCSEWQRVCEEIKSTNRVPIIIDNINETGVMIE